MMTPFPDAFRIRKIVLDAEEIQYAESANAATSGTAQVAAIGRLPPDSIEAQIPRYRSLATRSNRPCQAIIFCGWN
jgi:hypothetical protein